MDRMPASTTAHERWEVGSEFHHAPPQGGPYERFPDDMALFALAQHGVIALWRSVSPVPGTLWVPDYYCPPVLEAWARAGIRLRSYEDDPRWAAPDWQTLVPERHDLVLAVNHFGLREAAPWSAWAAEHPGLKVVEDHSHDPFSTWVRTSSAAYAVASLRKTLPIPDGAIVWSPQRLPLPSSGGCNDWTGSALKLAAMTRKSDYLAGAPVEKDRYRELQMRGEAAMLAGDDLAMTPWSRSTLLDGIPVSWRARRGRNVRAFLAAIPNDRRFRALAAGPEADVCPFNAVLVFERSPDRDRVRQNLAEARIYTAVHWPQPADAPDRVRDLASRILTIPLDQRYDEEDVSRVVASLSGSEAGHGSENRLSTRGTLMPRVQARVVSRPIADELADPDVGSAAAR